MMNIGWFLAGGMLSLLNVISLWWTVNQLRPEAMAQAMGLTLGGMVARWLLAAWLFSLTLDYGFMAIVLALTGFLVVRWTMIYWLG